MCRHRVRLGLSRMPAELLFDPPHGLYRHSWEPRRQRHGTVNLDGFRIGWYQPGGYRLPARYRRAILIWTDGNLPDLARSVHTCAVLAAVRDATSGTSRDEAASAGRGTGLGSFGTSPPYGPTAWLNLLLAEGHTITATRWVDTLGYRATETTSSPPSRSTAPMTGKAYANARSSSAERARSPASRAPAPW